MRNLAREALTRAVNRAIANGSPVIVEQRPELRERYREQDWRYEVANGDTKLGYAEWIAHCCERDGV